MANIIGGPGSETLDGTPDADVILGLGGDDILFGGAGDDSLNGGEGFDRLFGGDGDDVLTADSGGSDALYGGDGDDRIVMTDSGPGAWARPGAGDDVVIASGADQILGYDDVEVVNLTVDLAGGFASGEIDGIAFRDEISGISDVRGSSGDDLLLGGAFDEWEGWRPGAGADVIDGRGGWDELMYHLDRTGRGVSVDLAAGEAVDPYGDVDVFTGIDAVRGTEARDALRGSDAAFESFRGLAGADVIDGGGGFDRVDHSKDAYYGGTGPIRANLRKHIIYDGFGDRDRVTGVEGVSGTERNDRIAGDTGDNRLEGQGGNDRLTAIGGDDVLIGGAGRDRLSGGVGADLLDGGEDDDILNGGRGRDVFRFEAGDGDDKVMRFEQGRDLIAFSPDAAGGFDDLSIRDTRHGAVIGYAGGEITVVRMGGDDLSAEDFLFS